MSTQNKTIRLESTSKLTSKAQELKSRDSANNQTDLTTKIPFDSQESSKSSDKGIFILFLFTNLFVNYDTGVIPASLVQIKEELNIDFTQEAALGSLVYLGLSAASLFVSPIFKKFDAKNVLGINILVNAVFCALFSYFDDLMILYFCRIMMGMTQAFCVIYAPVWVNEFSPANKNATWMGILHGFCLLGVMTGFVCAAIVLTYFSEYLTWRFAIQVQAICEIPIAIGYLTAHNARVDVLYSSKVPQNPSPVSPIYRSDVLDQHEVRIDAVSYNDVESIWRQMATIITNPTLVLMTLSLCSLYYVVTGIQYWTTMYMIQILEVPGSLAMTLFGIIAVTSPLVGVFVGGHMSDSLGGYKGDNRLTAVKLCCVFSIAAMLISIPLGYVYNPIFFISLLWALLFFGACIIPTATGIIVDCVPRDYQAATSSFSQLLYNIFGFFLAPFLSAIIMDRFEQESEGLTWGSVLWCSGLGVILIAIAWVDVKNKLDGFKEMRDEYESNTSVLSKHEVQVEIARRRAISLL